MPKISVVTEDEVDAAIAAAVGGVNSDLGSRLSTAEGTLSAATALPTVSTLVRRDSAGRFRAVDGTAVGDVATKGQLDTAIATRVATSAVGAASGVATLDGTGKVPQSQLPAVALTEFLGAVGSQAAMLALSGQRGDWATRTDRGTDWQLIAEPSTALASWREMTYPASPVSSVDGRTGAVTLGTTTATANELVRRLSDGRVKAAAATETDDLVTLAALSSFGRDRGSGSTWPSTDLRRGDAYYHTAVAQLGIYSGAAWVLVDAGSVADISARNALSWAYRGLQVYVAADGVTYEYQNGFIGWTRPWGAAWGEMAASTLVLNQSLTNAFVEYGWCMAQIPKGRKLRLRGSAFWYSPTSSATRVRSRVVVTRDTTGTPTTVVYTGNNYDIGIGPGYGDIIDQTFDSSYTTAQAIGGSINTRFALQAMWALNAPNQPVATADTTERNQIHIVDVGPAGAPPTS